MRRAIPVLFWIIGFILLVILGSDIGIPFFLVLAIIGTVIELIRERAELDKDKTHPEAQRFLVGKLFGVIICGILILIIYLLNHFHVLK